MINIIYIYFNYDFFPSPLQLSDLYPIARFTKKMDSKLNVSSTTPIPFTVELIKQRDTKKVLEMLKQFFFKVSKGEIISHFIVIAIV